MKILFTISSLDTGGAEKILTTLANHFDNMGHDITIVILSKDKPFFYINDTINLIVLDIKKRKSKILDRLNYIPSLINSLRKTVDVENPDIVISFMSEMNILSIISSKLAHKPILISERSSYDFLDIKPFWKKARRIIYPFADGLVVLNKTDMQRYSFVKYRYIIKNPLILKERHTNIKQEKIILCVGRLNFVKGFDMAIEAFSKIKQKDWRLVIVGDGKEREYLENLIYNLNMDSRVELVGVVKDVEYYYKRASIFVLSSRSEGFPGVLCEAMGYGCAVISFDCSSAIKDIITHNIDGVVVEAENINKLTKAINLLVDNPNKRRVLGQKAKEIRDKLNIDKIANRWLEITKNIVERV